MSEENTEGVDTFQRVSISNGIPVGGKVVWVIDESVPIENGRIKFYSRQFDCVFDIPVRQVKGKGAGYSKTWEKLPKQHLDILKWWIEQGSDFYDSYHAYEDILPLVKAHLSISTGAFQGRVSELRGLNIFMNDPENVHTFKIDSERVKEIIYNDGRLH